MFSSILPSVSSSLKFGQNGSSKQNRFSVQVFTGKAPEASPYPYPLNNQHFVDMAYQPMPRQGQLPPNWYSTSMVSSQYAPPVRPVYSIYPNATNDAFIYQQSSDSKSDLISDVDTLSINTPFSPALSIDSTMALKSPVDEEDPMDRPPPRRSATPGIRSDYPTSLPMQAQSMARTPSGRHIPEPYHSGSLPIQMRNVPAAYMPSGVQSMAAIPQILPPAGYPIEIPEYDPSTISEVEVLERDRIAKINAEYNAAASSSYRSTSTTSPELKGPAASGIRRAPSASPPKTPTQQVLPARIASSQPLHPDLHFAPARRSSRDEVDYSSSSYQERTNSKLSYTSSRDGSPPSVERVSSQLPPENDSQPETPRRPQDTRSNPSFDTSRDPTSNSERITAPSLSRRTTSVATVTPPETRNRSNSPNNRYSIYAPNPNIPDTSYDQHRPTYSAPIGPAAPRQRKSSIVGVAERYIPTSRPEAETASYQRPHARSDHREFDSRPPRPTDAPLSTPKDYIPSAYASSSDTRHSPTAVPHGPPIHHSIPAPGRDSPSSWSASSSESRKDARTHGSQQQERDRRYVQESQQYPSERPSPSRRPSYVPDTLKDHRSHPESREIFSKSGSLTSSPKDIKDEPLLLEPVHVPIHDSSYDYGHVRERSTSFSTPSRHDLPPTTTASSHPRQGTGYPETKYASDYDRERDHSKEREREREREHEHDRDRDRRRRDRSGTITDRSPTGSRSSDDGHHQKPYTAQSSLNGRRDEPQRGSSSTPPTSHTPVPVPPHGYATRDRDQGRDHPSQRRAATVETASSSSSSSGSPDSQRSRKTIPFTQPQPQDDRKVYAEKASTPQPPAYSPPRHPELHRRQSDGDQQPYDISDVLPPSTVSQHEKRPPSSASTSSSSSQSTIPIHIPPPGPQRRFSDSDKDPVPIRPPTSGRSSVPLGRNVRWNENLVAPSPSLAPLKRKGWFNRRGDQLWTNDGSYKPALPGQEFPPDLDEYPDYGEGWMNEECIRIDMSHRLVPKVPLRSALKTCITKA